MTLQLELPPETEAALIAKAAMLGVPVDRYAVGVLTRDATPGAPAQPIHFSSDRATRRQQLRQLMTASPDVRAATLAATGQAAAEYYDSSAGRDELADWRALDGEAFLDD